LVLTHAGKEFKKCVAETQKSPWKNLWDEDKQLGNKSSKQYQKLAHELRIEMLLNARNLMLLAPNAVLKDDREHPHYKLYTLADMDALITQIRDNPEDTRFIKSMESIEIKLKDPKVNGEASNIGDYLRFQILSSDMTEIISLRAALMGKDSPVTSYKDQFRRPCKEGGHRAFKFHMEIGSIDKLVVEGQIGHLKLEELTIVKNLRFGERHLKEAFQSVSCNELDVSIREIVINAMDDAAGIMLTARKALNYAVSKQSGLDLLLDADINAKSILQEARDSLKSATPQTQKFLTRSPSFNEATQFLDMHLH